MGLGGDEGGAVEEHRKVGAKVVVVVVVGWLAPLSMDSRPIVGESSIQDLFFFTFCTVSRYSKSFFLSKENLA